MSNGQELATRSSVSVALTLNTLPAVREFCQVLAKTDMVPKPYKDKPDDILVAMLHGQEVGLPHLQALQSIAVVNGIPSIYGDAALAMVRASGKLEDFDEWIEVDGKRQEGPFPILKYADDGKSIVAFCKSKRVGMSRERITTYSVDDAKRAKLWEKKGHNGFETPWCTVPQRMLMWRARGWNLRDQFGDVLKGLAIYEEAMDIETTPGRDGVYRPTHEVNGQTDGDMERVQEAMRERDTDRSTETKPQASETNGAAPDAKPANDKTSKPKEAAANDLKGNQKDLTGEEWNNIVSAIVDDPNLRDIKERVKLSMKIKTLRLTAPGQHEFLRRFRAECETQGLGPTVKRILG